FVKGPDFPTGGLVFSSQDLRQAYGTGRGAVVTRGEAEILENSKGHCQIIISSIPYQVNKSELISKMADLVHEKKLALPLYSQFIPLPVSGNTPETFSPAALTQSITSLPSLLQGVRSQEVDKIYRRLGLDNGGSRINRDASEAEGNNYRTNMENLTTHLAQGIKRDELDSISKIMAAVAKDSSTVNDSDKEDLIKRINDAGKTGNATVLNDVLRNELKDTALQQYSIEESLARGSAAKPAPTAAEPTTKSRNYDAAVDSLKDLTAITEAEMTGVGTRLKKVIDNSDLDEEKKTDLKERTDEAVTTKKIAQLNAILRETGEPKLQSTTLTITAAPAAPPGP
ncbi:MAG: DNA gyrase subunit A, partial [Patescibacteria group bacterium]